LEEDEEPPAAAAEEALVAMSAVFSDDSSKDNPELTKISIIAQMLKDYIFYTIIFDNDSSRNQVTISRSHVILFDASDLAGTNSCES